MFGHNLAGTYIAFEGGEGCGKTTQQRLLVERMRRELPSREIVLTIEPGGTLKAEEIRKAIFEPTREGEVTLPLTEVYLFAAARHQNIEMTTRPALERGAIVISDRCFVSSLVYQGIVRGVGWQRILRLNQGAIGDVRPNLIILLDIDPEIGLSRKSEGNEVNRFEKEALEFHQKVRGGYLFFAEKLPGEILKIDGSLPQEAQAEIIWEKVKELVIDKESRGEIDHSPGRRR